MKLIKLSEDHYIAVDDSEIKEGDWVFNYFENSIKPYGKFFADDWLKITHSTQPELLGNGWMQSVKPLLLSEVEEAIYGYSAEKMADNWFYNEENKNHYENYNEKPAWVKGFKAHQELVKDKLFTTEDMERAYEEGFYQRGTDSSVKDPSLYIQSLLPKTEWQVEFDEQGKLKLI